MMGSVLAETRQVERIEKLLQPIKDIFGAVFFVSVGMLIDPQVIIEHYVIVLLHLLYHHCRKSYFYHRRSPFSSPKCEYLCPYWDEHGPDWRIFLYYCWDGYNNGSDESYPLSDYCLGFL